MSTGAAGPLSHATDGTGGAADQARVVARIEDITRITLRPLASPLPLGFFTVALATGLASSLQLGLVDRQGAVAVGLLIAPAFVLQFLVTVFALLSRDAMAATVMGTFAGSWLVDALIFTLQPADANQALAVFLFLFTAFVAMMAYTARPKAVLCVVLTIAIPRFLFSALFEATQSVTIERIAGVIGFVLVAAALYTAWALLLEDMAGKAVFPVGRRGPALAALEGEVADQLLGLEHNAGVRRTL
jgi:succinate-acetate transporter protein